MPDYRRMYIPGGTYFFSVALAARGSGLLVAHIDDLRRAYAATVAEAPVRCDAMVVLPDHLHAVWTLPEGDADYPERWRKIKARFSRRVGNIAHPTGRSTSKMQKREVGIWQRRYWEHTIRDAADFHLHVDYCRSDPVRHGLVARAADWPHSSIHRDIRLGRVDPEWSCKAMDGRFGE